MRISDWSSDVCSSDLRLRGLVEAVVLDGAAHLGLDLGELADDPAVHPLAVAGRIEAGLVAAFVHLAEARGVQDLGAEVDRKCAVEGKSVQVRVDLGGRRIIKKKTKNVTENSTEIVYKDKNK